MRLIKPRFYPVLYRVDTAFIYCRIRHRVWLFFYIEDKTLVEWKHVPRVLHDLNYITYTTRVISFLLSQYR